jgi:hypothetical protein
LEIVLSKEEKTIIKNSITNEISIPLTHQSMDPLQKKFLVLVPGSLPHFLTQLTQIWFIFKGAEHREVKWVLVQVNRRMN